MITAKPIAHIAQDEGKTTANVWAQRSKYTKVHLSHPEKDRTMNAYLPKGWHIVKEDGKGGERVNNVFLIF